LYQLFPSFKPIASAAAFTDDYRMAVRYGKVFAIPEKRSVESAKSVVELS
jgi:hypothetical protein